MRGARAAALAALALSLPMLSGCLGALDEYYGFDPDAHYRNPGVFEGEYRFGDGYSLVLRSGLLQPGPPEVVYLESERPAYAADPGAPASATVHIPMAIWRPQNVTGPVPVVVDAGPYYEVFSHCEFPNQDPCMGDLVDDTIDYPGQSTPFLLANVLPHGYAVVQLAVRGTGTAGGCMDLMGDDEQHDLDQAIRWLGEQPWSNGRVAMMGVSYDGSTPWTVAAAGNPHLKTIVPVSGLPDFYDLMFHNGSAETRGATMHSVTYWGFGFDDEFPQNPGLPEQIPWLPPAGNGLANGRETYQDLQNLCPSALTGAVMGPLTAATGDRHDDVAAYWAERDHRQAVLDNYEGSVFLVHGLQDWNVDPHSAIPFNAALRAKGLEVKEWYGQWDHANPDSRCQQSVPDWVTLPCRLDYAETLLRWFERHLKGDLDIDVGPAIQVQDNVGFWRNADAFPPANPDWMELRLDGQGALAPEARGGETRVQLMPPMQGGPSAIVEARSEPVADDLRISGLPQLKLPFEAGGPGGEIAVWLFDEDPEGKVRAVGAAQMEPVPGKKPSWMPVPDLPLVGHAQMNLRYHAGGEEPQALQPNTRYVAQVELEPLEAVIPKGHRVLVWVFQYAYPDHQASQTPSPVTVILGPDAVLRLPTVDDDPRDQFPVPGAHYPSRGNQSLMYVLKPVFDPSGPTVPPLPPADAAPAAAAADRPRCALACLP